MSTAAEQRKKNRLRAEERRRQIENQKKLLKIEKVRKGKKQVSRKRVNGKLVNTTSYYGGNKISNIGQHADYGQRASRLKNEGLGGIGSMSDYKKTEKKAFKEEKKWQKSDEKKKIIKKRNEKLKINKNKNVKNNSSSSSSSSKWIRTSKGTLARRGTVAARAAENKERARKRAQEMAKKRLANK